MKKKYLFVVACLLILALSLSVAACGGNSNPQPSSQPGNQPSSQPSNQPGSQPSSQPNNQPDNKPGDTAPQDSSPPPLVLPSMITIGTHATGSLYNNMGAGLATVVTRHTPMEVKVSAMTGPVEWMPMFTTGEIELGVLNCWDAQQAWLGGFDYQAISPGGNGFPVRLVTNGSFNIASILVADDSGITTAEDLYGHNYVLTVTGSAGITMQNEAFLANQQLDRNRLTMVSVTSIVDGVDAIIEGRSDATSVSIGVARTEELDSTRGARFLDWDPSPEAVARANEYFPMWIELVEPGPGKTGVVKPTYMYFFSNYLVSRTDVSDDIIYAVVEALWNNYDELAAIHPMLVEWKPATFVTEGAVVPYHPGAIKFFKEQGIWTDTMEARQQELLAMGN